MRVSTFNALTGDVGVILDDIWDDTVLAAFAPNLVLTDTHCPMIGAQEGFSRSTKITTSVISLLQDAQPYFLPEGELTCALVSKHGVQYPRTLFFPEVCIMPIGMRWPIDIDFPDFLSSIQAVLGQAGVIFQQSLLALEPTITTWFEEIDKDTAAFLIPGCPVLPLCDHHFPTIDTGSWPDMVQDQEGFSPLLDMLHGHIWRLWCDRILTTESKINRTHLQTFLTIGTPAIMADTYLGMEIPGRFCPNYAHYFTVVNGWPTDSTGHKFLGEFQHLPMISYQARQYDPVDLDLYQPTMTVPPLTTREDRTSAAHKVQTPKFSYPQGTITPTIPTDTNKMTPTGGQRKTPHSPAITIPSSVKPLTPSPAGSKRAPQMQTSSAQRRLDDDLVGMMGTPLRPLPSSQNDVVKLK